MCTYAWLVGGKKWLKMGERPYEANLWVLEIFKKGKSMVNSNTSSAKQCSIPKLLWLSHSQIEQTLKLINQLIVIKFRHADTKKKESSTTSV